MAPPEYLEQALAAQLKTYPALLAAVEGRVTPDVLPKDPVLPAIVYQQAGTPDPGQTFGSHVTGRGVRYQVGAWATSRREAVVVATIVRRALLALPAAYAGYVIGVELTGELPTGPDPDTGRYSQRVECIVSHDGEA